MHKIKLFLILTSLFLLLTGCQNNTDIEGSITSIEVYNWDSDILVTTIDDKQIIKKLVNQLNSARTKSTENMDYELPDYQLVFKSDSKNEFEIGYYKDLTNLFIMDSRYLKVDKDLMYGVDMKLLIE